MAKAESCFHCVYSRWDRNQTMWMMGVGMPSRPMCANQEEFPGRMKECPLGRVCRNFRARPPTPKGETVKTIPLGDGYYAYVDAADYEWLSRWTWHLYGGYAARYRSGKYVYLHREIMKPPRGMIVDHKNRNKLDDTRDNLRNATRAENMRNKGKQHGASSRFTGVSYNKARHKYLAQIRYKGRAYGLGLYVEEIDAAKAYDLAAVALFGEFARVNFPEEWPPQRRREVYAQRDAVLKKLRKRRAKIRERRAEGRGRPKNGNRRTEDRRQRTAKEKNRKARAETRGRGGRERKTKSKRATGHEPQGTVRKEKGGNK